MKIHRIGPADPPMVLPPEPAEASAPRPGDGQTMALILQATATPLANLMRALARSMRSTLSSFDNADPQPDSWDQPPPGLDSDVSLAANFAASSAVQADAAASAALEHRTDPVAASASAALHRVSEVKRAQRKPGGDGAFRPRPVYASRPVEALRPVVPLARKPARPSAAWRILAWGLGMAAVVVLVASVWLLIHPAVKSESPANEPKQRQPAATP
jgi:hypothetical protein